jgi:hypothetical protein
MPTLGGNHDSRVHLRVPSGGADTNAAYASVFVDEWRECANTGRELGPGGNRRLEQEPIQNASLDRGVTRPKRIIGCNRNASGARHNHARDGPRPAAHRLANGQAIEDGQGAGIDRVATEFRTWKGGEVDDLYA